MLDIGQKTLTCPTALYCRVASSNQYDTFAIDSQMSILRAFAEKHRFTDCVEYLDNGCNGLSFDRPAFIQMDADISAGKICTVIVRSFDRIARDTSLVTEWVNSLKSRNAILITADFGFTDMFPLWTAVEFSRMT